MRGLLDTDVVLDVLLQRHPFVQDSLAVWQAHIDGRFDGYVTAITPINVFYIARKLKGAGAARRLVDNLLKTVGICPVDQTILHVAFTLPMADYEDAVQHASAQASQLDAIITRNVSDYTGASLPVLTPADFLQQLSQSGQV